MFYLIIATICFSLSFGLIKSQLSILPSEFVVLCRVLIASIIFLPFVKKLTIKKHLQAMIIGAIQFGIMYLCFIKAFKYLQGNEIALLTTTTPIFVALWSIMFKEKFKPVYILCILLSVIGAGIIVWKNISFDMIVKGVILMETCNCMFALGQVLWKKFIKDESLNIMFSAYFGALIIIIPFVTIHTHFSLINLSLNQIFALLYLGIIPTGIGFWLWNKGAKQVKYPILSIMNNFKIPLGVFFSIFLFKERICTGNFIIGSIIIIISMLILHINLRNKH